MDITQKIYQIEGMHCAGCVNSVETSLMKIDGVLSAVVNLPLENVLIEKNSEVSFEKLFDGLQKAGFKLIEESHEDISARKEQDIQNWGKRLLFTGILGFPLLIFAMWEMITEGIITLNSMIIQLCLTTPIIYISRHFYKNGFTAFINRSPNMNSLVALGTAAAYMYSIISSVNIITGLGISGFEKLYFESAGIILVFITLGRYLEARAKRKTTAELLELFQQTPRTGWIKRKKEWVEVPVDEIILGDEIMIKPGSQIPVDGVIVEGTSFVNESTLTGEPLPVEKKPGDKLMGSALNTSGMLIMKAENVGKETVFAQIIQLVEKTQNTKAPIQNLANRVAAVFVPIVLILAILSSTAWFISGESLVFAMNILISVLIIACPCALGLATPTAVMLGTGIAAKAGIHYKSAEGLQNLSEITTFIFDKTGTLTQGTPTIVDLASAVDEKDFLFYLASLEKSSEHPLAEAVLQLTNTQKIKPEVCENLEALPGRGIQGMVQGKKVQAGSIRWLTELNISIPKEMYKKSQVWEKEGKTLIHTAVNGSWIGMTSVADTMRKESADVIHQLKQHGLEIYLLTGDQKTSGEHFASKLGIEKVFTGLLPHEKVERVCKIQQSNGKVAMVGDGINDAPALAAADIGIAIGSGTDIAMETSDVVLMRDDLSSLINAWQLSKLVVNKIKQNLFWAFAYNVVGIPIAMGLLYPYSGYLLNPMLAGAAMAFSSVSVVGNTLLLKRRI